MFEQHQSNFCAHTVTQLNMLRGTTSTPKKVRSEVARTTFFCQMNSLEMALPKESNVAQRSCISATYLCHSLPNRVTVLSFPNKIVGTEAIVNLKCPTCVGDHVPDKLTSPLWLATKEALKFPESRCHQFMQKQKGKVPTKKAAKETVKHRCTDWFVGHNSIFMLV